MIYEASFSGVLRIIFWILVFSFIIRLIARMALPYVMKKAGEQMQENIRRQQEAQRPSRREGDVIIESGKKRPSKDDSGEYTDYVEIKD